MAYSLQLQNPIQTADSEPSGGFSVYQSLGMHDVDDVLHEPDLDLLQPVVYDFYGKINLRSIEFN